MAANSNINSLLIDNTFPIANKAQSSQGFRSNWTAIQNNFNYTKSDILNLQNKTITLNGDITGTSPILDSGSSGITFTTTFTPSGLDNLTPGNYTSNFENIINFTVDTRGLITRITSSNREKTFQNSGNITAISNLDQNEQYSGITSINIPIITYNEYGLITSIEQNLIQGFGITDLYMPKNSLLVGNTSSISSFLPAPSQQSVLAFNGSSISWQETANIASVNSGNMIYTNIDNFGNLTISVSYTNLNYNSNITNNSEFAVYDGTNYTLTKLSDIISFLDTNYQAKVFSDKAPKLGGNLDVNNFSIINSENGEINLNSKQINLTSSDHVNLNGLLFGNTTLPNTSSVLTTDSTGNITFQDETSLTNVNNKLTKILLTEDNQSQQISASLSLNYFIKSTGYTNLNLVFDRTNYNTNTTYSLIYSLYFEITNNDMILNFTGDNSSSVYLNGMTSSNIGIIEDGTAVPSTQIFTSDPSGYSIESTGGSGTGATFTVTSNEQNTYTPASIVLNAAGSGYAVNDTITLPNIGTVTVTAVNSGAISTISSVLSTTSQTTDMAGNAVTGTTSGSGTGATFTVTSNETNAYVVSSIALNYTGSGYKTGDILNITGGVGIYTVKTVSVPPTNLTLKKGYIYKINAEYYNSDCWILDIVFKSEKS